MIIDGAPSGFNGEDIGVLLESLKYSIRAVSDAQGTPYGVRQDNLQRLYRVQEKLREMRIALCGSDTTSERASESEFRGEQALAT
jgi:hypothetical protein